MKCLETLNLYFNNIPDLKEVFRLRHNTKLKDLDLRLNPVTKHEPDYRLFIIHMLVHLRKLDDRLVTDEERKAALMHFDTDQAYDFDKHVRKSTLSPTKQSDNTKENNIDSRVNLVNSMAPRRSGLGVDTEELLELMAERGVVSGTVFVQTRDKPDKKEKKKGSSTRKPLREKNRTGNMIMPHPPPVPLNKELTEFEAYNAYQPVINFTPHPISEKECISKTREEGTSTKEEKQPTSGSGTKDRSVEGQDKKELLKEKDEEISLLRNKMEILEREIITMKENQQRQEELETLLQQAYNDLSTVHQHCQALVNENSLLKSIKQNDQRDTIQTELLTNISQVTRQQEFLCEEVRKISQRQTHMLSYSSQLQSLASMLQESHKCLISTNTQLLQQQDDMREKHSLEILQLNHNYETLRKTLQHLNV